jgi:hypothetical protein
MVLPSMHEQTPFTTTICGGQGGNKPLCLQGGPSNEQQHSFITPCTITYKQHHYWNHTTNVNHYYNQVNCNIYYQPLERTQVHLHQHDIQAKPNTYAGRDLSRVPTTGTWPASVAFGVPIVPTRHAHFPNRYANVSGRPPSCWLVSPHAWAWATRTFVQRGTCRA